MITHEPSKLFHNLIKHIIRSIKKNNYVVVFLIFPSHKFVYVPSVPAEPFIHCSSPVDYSVNRGVKALFHTDYCYSSTIHPHQYLHRNSLQIIVSLIFLYIMLPCGSSYQPLPKCLNSIAKKTIFYILH